MRHPALVRLRRFVEHPLTQLVVGVVLAGTGMVEAIGDLAATDRRWRIGVHHGVILLGLLQVLQNLPLVVEGLERWFDATDASDSPTPPSGPA